MSAELSPEFASLTNTAAGDSQLSSQPHRNLLCSVKGKMFCINDRHQLLPLSPTFDILVSSMFMALVFHPKIYFPPFRQHAHSPAVNPAEDLLLFSHISSFGHPVDFINGALAGESPEALTRTFVFSAPLENVRTTSGAQYMSGKQLIPQFHHDRDCSAVTWCCVVTNESSQVFF